jgi:mono/diheme cytochrome c family protein
MPHSMIVRVAWGLSVFLVLACAAFAWAANQRERHYEQLIAQAAQEAEATRAASAPESASAAPAADPAAAAAAAKAAYEKRCAKCHEPDEMAAWVSTLQSGGGEAAAFEFLQKHRKAPEPENRVLAAWFAGGGTVE